MTGVTLVFCSEWGREEAAGIHQVVLKPLVPCQGKIRKNELAALELTLLLVKTLRLRAWLKHILALNVLFPLHVDFLVQK